MYFELLLLATVCGIKKTGLDFKLKLFQVGFSNGGRDKVDFLRSTSVFDRHF